MKYYPNNLDQIIEKARKKEISTIVLYGPDSGMVSEFVKKIAKSLSLKQNNHKFETASGLFASLNNISFFSEKELIKVEYNSAKLDEETQNIITGSNIHLPVFVVDELPTSSSFRKFFEADKNSAIIACYPDDEKSIRQIIISKVTEAKKQLTPEALEFLMNKLHGDRLLIINELEKLLSYAGDDSKITMDHCAIISESIESHPDLLCIYFAKKKGDEYLKELNNLLENGISVIWIIRALARYYQNLLIVKFQELDGVGVETSMAKLRPPIFFKYSAAFKEIANKSSIKDVSNMLNNLTKAEVEAKNGYSPESVMDNLFIGQFATTL